MLHMYVSSVSGISDVCYQLFHTDVAQVDWGMLQLFQRHVASVCFECFRCLKGMFHLCFLDACCDCVYLDVAYVSHFFFLEYAKGLRIFVLSRRIFYTMCHEGALGSTSDFTFWHSLPSEVFEADYSRIKQPRLQALPSIH
jgi:hypothetical protein